MSRLDREAVGDGGTNNQQVRKCFWKKTFRMISASCLDRNRTTVVRTENVSISVLILSPFLSVTNMPPTLTIQYVYGFNHNTLRLCKVLMPLLSITIITAVNFKNRL